MLAGTGAALKVEVKVTGATQAPGPQTAASADTAPVDPLLARTVPVQASSQPDTNGSGLGGQTTAAPQDAGRPALQPGVDAQAAEVAAVQSVEAAAAPQAAPQQEQSQMPQGIAGVAAAAPTQAAQKATPAQAPQAPQQPSEADQQKVMDQVSVQIAKAAKDGTDTIKVQLKPQDLGRIEIKLEVGTDGKVTATVTADNKDTLAMLQKDAAGLAKSLSDAGLKADAGAMNFNLRGGGQQNTGDGNQGSGGRRRRVATGLDATSEATAAQASRWAGRSAVDIQV